MSKAFYFSLMGMLAISVYATLTGLSEHIGLSEFNSQDKKPGFFLVPEFDYYDFSFPVASAIIGLLFFAYRFHESIIYPILDTIVTFIYLFLVWKFAIGYCVNPVGYFSSKGDNYFNPKNHYELNRMKDELACCGINHTMASDSDECRYRHQWSCARAVVLHKGKTLRERAYKQFMLSFFHVASLISLWSTHLLGGLDFEADIEQYQQIDQSKN